MKNNISIIIPVHNEEKAISKVVNDLRKEFPDIEIIIINDGSTDSTYDKINKLDAKIINHDKCYGYGTALRSGIEASNCGHVLFCDGDGQHRVEDVIMLMKDYEQFDMIVGARGKDSHSQLNRVPGKAVLAWFAKILLGEKIPDLNSGLRILRKSIIDKYLHLMPTGFSFSTTCTFAFMKDSRSIKWVPIQTVKRHGVSTVRQLKDGPSTLLLLLRLSILFEPLKIFLFATKVLFLLTIISLLLNTFLVGEFNITDATVILGLGTLIVFLSGLLCDQVSAIRRNL